MNSSKTIKMLKDDRWEIKRIQSSHHHFKHPSKKGIVTVPRSEKDLPIGTVNNILK